MTSEQGSADRPARVGWHLARARERAGLSLEAAAAAAAIPAEELDALECGWRELLDGETTRLAAAYGVTVASLVPPRTPVVVDSGAGTIAIGDRRAPLGAARDDALGAYLSMIYEARGAARGDRIALRDDDLDVLAGLVGDDASQVEARLIELMGCSEEDARRLRVLLFRRRMLAGAAGVLLALGVTAAISQRSAQERETTSLALSVPDAVAGDTADASSSAAEVGPASSVEGVTSPGPGAEPTSFSSSVVPPRSEERKADDITDVDDGDEDGDTGIGVTPRAESPRGDGAGDDDDDVDIDLPEPPPFVDDRGGVGELVAGLVGDLPLGGGAGGDDAPGDVAAPVDDGNNGGGNDEDGDDDDDAPVDDDEPDDDDEPVDDGNNGGGNDEDGDDDGNPGKGDDDDEPVDDDEPADDDDEPVDDGNNGGGNDEDGDDDGNPGKGDDDDEPVDDGGDGGDDDDEPADDGNNGGGNDDAPVDDGDDDEPVDDGDNGGGQGGDGDNGHGNDEGGVDPSNPGGGGGASDKPKKDK